MHPFSRSPLRWLLYVLAAVVIAMALVVGAARLLLPLVPDYQDDIRAWASEATGYDIRFQSISASWPLSGPELSFYGVSLTRPGESEAVISAREFSAGLSLWQLLRDARPAVGRISVSGSSLRVERTAEGEWRIQGRHLRDLLPQRHRPPEIDLDLTDIAVTFLDPSRDPRPVALTLARLRATLEPDDVTVAVTIDLPGRFGRRLDIELNAPGELPSPLALPPSWDARVRGRGLDLATLLTYVLAEPPALHSATGDATVEVQVRERKARRLRTEISLANVTVGPTGDATVYERLSGAMVWGRTGDGWEAQLERLRLRRDGRDAPAAAGVVRFAQGGAATAARWSASAQFLRLEDLFPLVRAGLAGTEFEPRLPRVLRGDLHELEAELHTRGEAPWRYSLQVDFDQFGATLPSGEVAVSGLSGSLAADSDGGRLQLASRKVGVDLSQWFREPLRAQSVDGLVVWRAGSDGIRFLSDDMRLLADAIEIRSRVELVVPPGDESPVIDLKARASATEAREVLRYLPLRRFPPKVVDWLERSVVAGRVPTADVEFRGPVRGFPYDRGQGIFRVALNLEDATLDFANGWPRVEGLDAEVVFDGVGMYSTTNSARLGGLAVKDYAVMIPDLRRGILAVSGRQRGGLEQMLAFVRATPLAAAIGPTLDRVTGSGPVDAAIRLALPIAKLSDYDLQVLFDARGCRVGLKKLPLDLRDLRGRVRLQNTRFSGAGLRAVMLGEPVTIGLRAQQGPNGLTTHVADVQGATPVARLTSTFSLPLRRYVEGNLGWQATVTLPPRRRERQEPIIVSVRSDLRGVASSLPAPLAKPAPDPWPLVLNLAFPDGEFIDMTGQLTPPFAWALRLASVGGNWRVERGMLRAGPGEALLPGRRGVEVVGHVGELPLADWLGVGDGGGGSGFRETYREVALRADKLLVAGQIFRDVEATVQRGADAWAVQVTGPGAEGALTVPFDLATRPLLLDMKRLWLIESAPDAGGERIDPRKLPALEVKVGDAALGPWNFGQLEMGVEKTPAGLVARRITTRAPSFRVDANAAWSVEGNDLTRQSTQLQATLASTELRPTLEQLGFGPVLSAEKARITTRLAWPDGPTARFLDRATGQISIAIEDGQVLDLEPGSGRLLGLLSVTTLPRRLALDFSDIFRKGLAFDTIKGDFRVGSGSAYTCNLGLAGPAADIGIVGRTGFASRDYDQFAVVRPQVSSVLTVGGAVLGGPVGGATMLLISQLFRKPLSTLGESYYRVSGAWDQPAVVRVERAGLDASAFKDCEKEVAAALRLEQQATPAQVPATPVPAGPP